MVRPSTEVACADRRQRLRRVDALGRAKDPHVTADQFAEVAAAGRNAILDGTHGIEGPPERTGRWGPSMVFRPRGELSDALAALANEAAAIAGSHHWRSGDIGRAHLTVRALEPYTDAAPEDRLARYLAAARRAAAALGPIRLAFHGVVLSAGSVMARARPLDDRADRLRQRLDAELGDDGWLERHVFPNGRDPIWYCSVPTSLGRSSTHTASSSGQKRRTHAALGEVGFTELDLCTCCSRAWR